jgi:hypothetical protein
MEGRRQRRLDSKGRNSQGEEKQKNRKTEKQKNRKTEKQI